MLRREGLDFVGQPAPAHLNPLARPQALVGGGSVNDDGDALREEERQSAVAL